MTALADSRALAARARELADAAPAGSLTRRAWACCSIALSTTRTPAAARRALADVRLPDVRGEALRLLAELDTAARPPPGRHTPPRTAQPPFP